MTSILELVLKTAIYVSEVRWLFCPSHFPREQAKAPCVEYITTRKQNSGETQDKNIFKMQGALTMVTWWCLPPEILNTKWLCFLTWFFKKMTLYVVDEWWFILPSPFPILWMRRSSATKKNPKKYMGQRNGFHMTWFLDLCYTTTQGWLFLLVKGRAGFIPFCF